MNTINSINPKNVDSSKYFLITIDVEDWFQVENFKPWIPFETWEQRELRVEKNVRRLLDLFDSIELPPHTTSTSSRSNAPSGIYETTPTLKTKTNNSRTPRATFFILGWIAERLPHIVRAIAARGHEVASHGCDHDLPNKLKKNKLKNDLNSSRKRLEDTIGAQVRGYRAPSFAINDRVIRLVEECGYLYDSSYNSFGLHRRYGKISFQGFKKHSISYKLSDNFYEVPISNIDLKVPLARGYYRAGTSYTRDWNVTLPFGGGGYFRLLPYKILRQGIRYKLQQEAAFVFYLHPWEIDPGQPKVKAAPFKYRFRHYSNLKSTYNKLNRMITDFRSSLFVTCTQYINEVKSRWYNEPIEKMN